MNPLPIPVDPELELWHEYKDSGNEELASELMLRLKPLVMSNVQKWHGGVPRSAINAKGYALARKAIDTFDPDRGVKLSTHVSVQVQPVSRLVYSTQNFAKVPEVRIRLAGAYQEARQKLRDELNREPSDLDIAEEMKVSPKQVTMMRKELWRDVISPTTGLKSHAFTQQNESADVLTFLYHELGPRERTVFEKLTGFNGHQKLNSSSAISMATGIPQGEVDAIRARLTARLREVGRA